MKQNFIGSFFIGLALLVWRFKWAILIVLLVFFGPQAGYQYLTVKTETVTVQKTERIVIPGDAKGNGAKSFYLVYTDKGDFKVTDSFWHWQWRSSDLYGKLLPNKQFTIKRYGWRWGWMSWYPTIYSVQ